MKYFVINHTAHTSVPLSNRYRMFSRSSERVLLLFAFSLLASWNTEVIMSGKDSGRDAYTYTLIAMKIAY